jgi:hypothetical protein
MNCSYQKKSRRRGTAAASASVQKSMRSLKIERILSENRFTLSGCALKGSMTWVKVSLRV